MTEAVEPTVTSEIKDGIATLTIQRPKQLNALNETVFSQMNQLLDEALNDTSVKGIVLAGSGRAFVAGADVKFFLDCIQEEAWDRAGTYLRQGADLYHKIDTSPKTVVARVHGLALGGGAELALAADYILADEKGSLGFPETSIGLFPGLGGTQRTSRRVGKHLTRWLVLSGKIVDSTTAKDIGLIDAVVPSEGLAPTSEKWAKEKRPAKERSAVAQLPQQFLDLEKYIAAHEAPRFLEGQVDNTDNPDCQEIAKQIPRKAPIAIRVADELIHDGYQKTLEKGLGMELSQFIPILKTKDALEGISALLEKRRPQFKGE